MSPFMSSAWNDLERMNFERQWTTWSNGLTFHTRICSQYELQESEDALEQGLLNRYVCRDWESLAYHRWLLYIAKVQAVRDLRD